MRAAILALTCTAALVAVGGCVQFHADVNLDGKGGGTAAVKFSVASDVLAARTELDRMGADNMGLEVPDYAAITRPYLDKRAAGRGVTVTAFDKTKAGGRDNLSCAITFSDLKGLSWMLNDVASSIGGMGLAVANGEGGNVVLKQRQYNFPQAARKRPAPVQPTPEQAQRQMQLAGTVMGALGELDIVFNVTVPGDVVRTNAPKRAGRTCTWDVNAQNMMARQDVSPEIVFSGKGLAITPTPR